MFLREAGQPLDDATNATFVLFAKRNGHLKFRGSSLRGPAFGSIMPCSSSHLGSGCIDKIMIITSPPSSAYQYPGVFGRGKYLMYFLVMVCREEIEKKNQLALL